MENARANERAQMLTSAHARLPQQLNSKNMKNQEENGMQIDSEAPKTLAK